MGVNENDDAPLSCYSDEASSWQLHFNADMSYSDNWLDVLRIVRRTQESVKIGYTPNSESGCAIEYLALVKDLGYGGVDVPSDNLSRTGDYGNIALNGTNGLTNNSYLANGFYKSDEASFCFRWFYLYRAIK